MPLQTNPKRLTIASIQASLPKLTQDVKAQGYFGDSRLATFGPARISKAQLGAKKGHATMNFLVIQFS